MNKYQVVTREIPKFTRIMESTQAALENDPDNIQLQTLLDVTSSSLSSWNQFLEDYESTNDSTDLVHVGEWYDLLWDADVKPKCEKKVDTFGCQFTNSTVRNYELQFHRCNREEPNMASIGSMFDRVQTTYYDGNPIWSSSERNIYRFLEDDRVEPKCEYRLASNGGEGNAVTYQYATPLNVVNHVAGDWTDLPDDHEYWEQWDFYHPKPDDIPIGLAPDTLVRDAVINPETQAIADRITQTPLSSTGRIQFSGGGGVYTMQMTSEQVQTLARKYAGASATDNAEQSFNVGVGVSGGFKINPLAIGWGVNAAYHFDVSHTKLSENEKSGETSISFEMSDPVSSFILTYPVYQNHTQVFLCIYCK